VDFRIARSLAEAKGTNYFGIGGGIFNDSYWEVGRYYVHSDVFWLLDGIIAKHFPSYDEYGINNIRLDVARKITADWREAAPCLTTSNLQDIVSILNLGQMRQDLVGPEIEAHRSEIATLLLNTAEFIEKCLETANWVNIDGL